MGVTGPFSTHYINNAQTSIYSAVIVATGGRGYYCESQLPQYATQYMASQMYFTPCAISTSGFCVRFYLTAPPANSIHDYPCTQDDLSINMYNTLIVNPARGPVITVIGKDGRLIILGPSSGQTRTSLQVRSVMTQQGGVSLNYFMPPNLNYFTADVWTLDTSGDQLSVTSATECATYFCLPAIYVPSVESERDSVYKYVLNAVGTNESLMYSSSEFPTYIDCLADAVNRTIEAQLTESRIVMYEGDDIMEVNMATVYNG